MRTVLVAFAIAFLVGLVCTWCVRELARRFHLYDDDDRGRKVHSGDIPRLGGIGVAIGFSVPLLGLYLWSNKISVEIWSDAALIQGLLLGGGVIFVTGLIDDLWELSAGSKLLGQLAAALTACAVGVQIQHLNLPFVGFVELSWMALPVTVFWFLLVTNAVNLVDGLDGLAGSVVVLAGGTLLAMSLIEGDYLSAAILASLVGGTLGFLRFNVRPASIFLGDTGSLFLGYTLALVSANSSQKSYALFSLTAAILALGVPIFDLGMAFFRRLLTGRSVFVADQHHVHHQLLRKGLSHGRSVLVMAAVSAGLAALALLVVFTDDRLSAVALVATVLLMVVAVRSLGYVELIRSARRQALVGASDAEAHEQLEVVLALRDQLRNARTPAQVRERIITACDEALGFERVVVTLSDPDLSLSWERDSVRNNEDVHSDTLESEVFEIRVSDHLRGQVEVWWHRDNAVLRAHHCALGQLLADGLLELSVTTGPEMMERRGA